ncbi:polyprenyl synthetase family protein [Paenibacillus sp. GCM10023252]|uniref:polyprenyl synthetase family protein n=1 Tax=Paenibacillus sp. GCM10023252 TaxID=3252649 RepID=UPI00360712E9
MKEPMKFGLLTLLHYRMFHGSDPSIYRAAASVELFILASDILDDLEDGDASSKVWMQCPSSIALHVASTFLSLSQHALLSSGFKTEYLLPVMEMASLQQLQSANGQMLDLHNHISDDDSYLAMVKSKSASLLIYACMTGVMLAGRTWHPIVAEYAQEVGIAAQIKNDKRDLLRFDEKNDFLNRKRTLLTIFLLESVTPEQQWIVDYYERRIPIEAIQGQYHQLEPICEANGTLLYASVMMRMHYNRFVELLDSLDEAGPFRNEFLQLLSHEGELPQIPQ